MGRRRVAEAGPQAGTGSGPVPARGVPGAGERRVTISDVAARARVSKSAVSFVFNGRRGLSAATTARIITAADELGWRPSARARALTGNGMRSVGLVIRREHAGSARDAEIAGFLEGLGTALAHFGAALVVRVVSTRSQEREAYAAFARESHVDVVVIEGSPEDDDRPALLTRLGLRSALADQEPAASGDAEARGRACGLRLAIGWGAPYSPDDPARTP